MTPTINNLIAGINLAIIFALIYLVKQVFDSERILAAHPYFKNKVLRMELAALVIIQFLSIIEPDLFPWPMVMFLVVFVLTLVTFGFLYEKHVTKISLMYSSTPVVDGSVYISIPTNKFVTVAPGVRDRRIPSRFDQEYRSLKDRLTQKINFQENYIILVHFEDGADFAEHTHLSTEWIHMLSGEVEMFEGITAMPGDIVEIPARKPHFFKATKAGSCIIEYQKVPS